MNRRCVDIDNVLDLFGVEDEDLYATGMIEDALYDGTLKVYELPFTERHGKWINGKCSVCGADAPYTYDGFWEETSYCPNCGVKMEVEE